MPSFVSIWFEWFRNREAWKLRKKFSLWKSHDRPTFTLSHTVVMWVKVLSVTHLVVHATFNKMEIFGLCATNGGRPGDRQIRWIVHSRTTEIPSRRWVSRLVMPSTWPWSSLAVTGLVDNGAACNICKFRWRALNDLCGDEPQNGYIGVSTTRNSQND